ncbi:MAG TPA: iron-containing alcohol dehydrogenase, partial [Casimicrobiaceae bacterium]|nr:iron-containing alcohol dehydrogenase [Casimicrobiaceae bacterium]
ANGIMIDHVMRFNAPAAAAKMAELARVAGVPGAGAMTETAAASAFVDWLSRMKADLGIPATLGALAAKRPVTKSDVPALVDVAINDTCHRTNPRPCTRADFEALFAAAL